jgi:hypothetical protein
MGQARIRRAAKQHEHALLENVSKPGFARVEAIAELIKLDTSNRATRNMLRAPSPDEHMSRQRLRRMGLQEIERKARAMFPHYSYREVKDVARQMFERAWSGRDKEAIARALASNDPRGIRLAIRPRQADERVFGVVQR